MKRRVAACILSFLIYCQAYGQFVPTNENQILGQKILNHYLKLHPLKTWDYDWTTAIFLIGAIQYCERFAVTKSTCGFVDEYFTDLKIETLPEVTMPDVAAMALPAGQWLQHATPIAKTKIEILLAKTKKYFDTEPLNRKGVFDHVGKRHSFSWWLPPTHWFMPSSVWADSSVMYAWNSFRLGRVLKDEKLENFGADQLLKIHRILFNETHGLYKHAYFISFDSFAPKSFWARGNGWMTLAIVEILSEISKENPIAPQLKAGMTSVFASLLTSFDSSRGLRTLLRAENSGAFESSSSALFVYSLLKADRFGFAHKQDGALAQAYKSALIKKYLVPVGESELSVTGISGPTTALPFDWYYTRLVPTRSDLSYGVGAFLLLLAEPGATQ